VLIALGGAGLLKLLPKMLVPFKKVLIGAGIVAGGYLLLTSGVLSGFSNPLSAASSGTASTATTVLIDDNVGDAATVTFDSYTGTWGGANTKTEVTGVFGVFDNGALIVNNNATSSISTVKGHKVNAYPMGSSFYGDAAEFTADIGAIHVFDMYDVSEIADTNLTVLDDNRDTLTNASTNSSVNYNGGDFAAGETKTFTLKFKQNTADEVRDIGAVCAAWPSAQEVDDVISNMPGWTSVSVPKFLNDRAPTAVQEAQSTNVTLGYKRCWSPSSDLTQGQQKRLKEFEILEFPFQIKASSSSAPTANGGSLVGLCFFDASYSISADGSAKYGWYRNDIDADPQAVGMNETDAGVTMRDRAACASLELR